VTVNDADKPPGTGSDSTGRFAGHVPASGPEEFAQVTKALPAFAQVASQLIRAIETGQFPVGSRLPPEQHMAPEFGVSRPTIREALSCLQFIGYIEPRRGSGTVVISTVARGATPLQPADECDPVDLFEARLEIEPLVVGLAAADPDPEELPSLRRVLEGMELTLAGSDVQARTDLNVHAALVRLCRNKVLAGSAERLLMMGEDARIRSVRQRAWDSGVLPREWLHHHQLMASAVMQRDPGLAARASRTHLLSVLTDLAASAQLERADRERVATLIGKFSEASPADLAAADPAQPDDARPARGRPPADEHRRKSK
jgi:DNA-binding FadR family transcriptional regulator